MTGQLEYSNEDYLTFKLYNASRSTRIKVYRFLGWLAFTLFCCVWAYFFYRDNNRILEYVSLAVAVLGFFFYPLFQRDRFKKRYARHVEATRKGDIDTVADLDVTIEHIFITGNVSDIKIKPAELSEIHEIPNYIFLTVRSRQSLMLPTFKLDHNALAKEFEAISVKYNVPYYKNLNWKFK